MNRRYGMVKLNENELFNMTKPEGFIAREKFVNGTPVSFEFGTYIDENIFFSVPMHFSLKDKLIPMESYNNDEFKYYMIPDNIQFAVKSYTNKKGKVNPLLIEANEKYPATFITAFSYRDNSNDIISLKLGEPNKIKVIRKYIDPNRKIISFIALNTDINAINPNIKVNIEYGVIGMNNLRSANYIFDPTIDAGHTKITNETITTKEPISTKFISLPMWNDHSKKKKNNKVIESNKNIVMESYNTDEFKYHMIPDNIQPTEDKNQNVTEESPVNLQG